MTPRAEEESEPQQSETAPSPQETGRNPHSGTSSELQCAPRESLEPPPSRKEDTGIEYFVENGIKKFRSTDLFVNYIPLETSEASLRELFGRHGQVVRIKLVPAKPGSDTTGAYAFVVFSSIREARAAFEALNGTKPFPHSDFRLKVRFATPKDSAADSINLYIAGLPAHYTSENIEQLFKDFSPILETRILKDSSGVSRGVGFCRVQDKDVAFRAIEKLNHTIPSHCENQITVKIAQRSRARLGMENERRPQHYSYAPVSLYGCAPGRDRGYSGYNPMGYSSFPPYAPPVVGAFEPFPTHMAHPDYFQDPYRYGGNACPRSRSGYTGFPLFIMNLPVSIDEATLFQLFSSYGTVTSVKVMRDLETGLGRGFGFVNLATFDEAETAIGALNNFQMGDRRLRIEHKKPKNPRQI